MKQLACQRGIASARAAAARFGRAAGAAFVEIADRREEPTGLGRPVRCWPRRVAGRRSPAARPGAGRNRAPCRENVWRPGRSRRSCIPADRNSSARRCTVWRRACRERAHDAEARAFFQVQVEHDHVRRFAAERGNGRFFGVGRSHQFDVRDLADRLGQADRSIPSSPRRGALADNRSWSGCSTVVVCAYGPASITWSGCERATFRPRLMM